MADGFKAGGGVTGGTMDTSHQGLKQIIFVCLCSVQSLLLISIGSCESGGMLMHIFTDFFFLIFNLV